MRFAREVAERLAAWLKEGHTQIKCQGELEAEVLASTKGTYRVAAAKTRGGQIVPDWLAMNNDQQLQT
jgi:hypothetical protein